jgi:hypothetical protein
LQAALPGELFNGVFGLLQAGAGRLAVRLDGLDLATGEQFLRDRARGFGFGSRMPR